MRPTRLWMFKKSGSIVQIVRSQTVEINRQKKKGYTVRRIDTGKEFFALPESLVPVIDSFTGVQIGIH